MFKLIEQLRNIINSIQKQTMWIHNAPYYEYNYNTHSFDYINE